MERQI